MAGFRATVPIEIDFKPKARMTRWYEPLAMFRLLLRIWATRRMDRQRHQEDAQPTAVFDYDDAEGDFWFDYVADLGDAFDPTMCVAWHLGRDRLLRAEIDPRLHIAPEFRAPGISPPPSEDIPDVLPRGRLLIMGGDQVYPNGSPARYRNQVVGPYRLAQVRTQAEAEADTQAASGGEDGTDTTPPGDLLALPANHDWYGGLGPFKEAFCHGRDIGGWRAGQQSSWWAARLAHDWWVWGVDTALDGTIDDAQYQYFRRVRDAMPPDARLIACLPVPAWRLRERYIDRYDNLGRFFFGLGVEPEVYLSGDYHIAALHRRDRPHDRPEWHLTSGGGGAFQHPVHNLDRRIPNKYGGLPEPKVADAGPLQLIATWPSNAESREGTGGWWHLLFDRAAISLIATLAALQLPFMWLAGADNRTEADNARSVAETVADHFWPVGVAFGLALVALAVFGLARASSASRGAMSWARSVGFGHGIAQALVFGAARLGGNLAVRAVAERSPDGPDELPWYGAWLVLAAAAIVAAIVSIVVLGTYLRFANQQFRMHDNESYSARHSGDNRNFARFRISPDGALSCYVIAFRHTGKGWADGLEGHGPLPPNGTSRAQLINVRFRTAPSEFPSSAPGTSAQNSPVTSGSSL